MSQKTSEEYCDEILQNLEKAKRLMAELIEKERRNLAIARVPNTGKWSPNTDITVE